MIKGNPKNLNTNPVEREKPTCILNYYDKVPLGSGEPGVGGTAPGYTPPTSAPAGFTTAPPSDSGAGTGVYTGHT